MRSAVQEAEAVREFKTSLGNLAQYSPKWKKTSRGVDGSACEEDPRLNP